MVGNPASETKRTLPILWSKWEYARAESISLLGTMAGLQVGKQAKSEAEF